jgi:hypothetical protein
VTATPISGRGSPVSDPSSPSCRSMTTWSWKSSLRASSRRPPLLQGPRLLRRLWLLLRHVRPLHHARPLHRRHLSWVPLPPGRAGVGDRGGRRRRAGGRGGGRGGVTQTPAGGQALVGPHGGHHGLRSTTHGQGASLCGPSTLLEVRLAHRQPCSLVLHLPASPLRLRGLDPPAPLLGLRDGTRRPWLARSTP